MEVSNRTHASICLGTIYTFFDRDEWIDILTSAGGLGGSETYCLNSVSTKRVNMGV